MAPASAPEPAFKKDEKVFCFHHELLYEAKVLEVRPVEEDKKNGFEYRVHYKGWKNTYVSPICLSLPLLAAESASLCGSHVFPRIHFTLLAHALPHNGSPVSAHYRNPPLYISNKSQLAVETAN
jgi:hypothetical protein